MAQSGLHTYIAFSLKNKISKKPWFFYSFLLGSILPDIDIILSYLLKIKSLFQLDNFNENIYYLNSNYWFNYNLSIFHSIITLSLIYLSLLVYYEIKRSKYILNIANGLLLGILLHIIVDIFFFLRPVQILWPLNLINIQPLNIWKQFNIPYFFIILHLSLEFLFFRLLSFQLIEILINNKGKGKVYLKTLTHIMEVEGILFIIYLIVLQFSNYKTLYFISYGFFYSLSLLIIIYLIYKTRININNFALSLENRSKSERSSDVKQSTIDNIG